MFEPWTDAELLTVLDLCFRQGLTRDAAGARVGRVRNSTIGAVNRVVADDRKVADLCVKPENQDGGMPADWWRAGVRVQARANQVRR